MYSLDGKIYFGRYNNSGTVRLLIFTNIPQFVPKLDGIYPEAIVDKLIDSDHWCSIICEVSFDSTRYKQASSLHNG